MAKSKQTELDVDFIGDQEPLTKEEQLLISNFFSKKKPKRVSTKLYVREKSKRTTRA